jgi:hypothetical protein
MTTRPFPGRWCAMSASGQKQTFALQNVMSALPRKRTRLHDFTVASSHRAKSKTHRSRRHRLFRIRESSKAYGVGPTGRPGIQIRHGSAYHS